MHYSCSVPELRICSPLTLPRPHVMLFCSPMCLVLFRVFCVTHPFPAPRTHLPSSAQLCPPPSCLQQWCDECDKPLDGMLYGRSIDSVRCGHCRRLFCAEHAGSSCRFWSIPDAAVVEAAVSKLVLRLCAWRCFTTSGRAVLLSASIRSSRWV